ncbi:ABC transporter permease [Ectobacillus sp. sgz5001026]|uniref:ABC transporter permease n=1 Tax=Ectobacillus sp. sgz5001026 TaxID=3242473 RepID=UPI0036D406B2
MSEKTIVVSLPAKKAKTSGNSSKWLLGTIFPVLLLVIWEWASRFGIISAHLLPSPSTILATIGSMAQDGTLWGHIGFTLVRIAAGFAIGIVIATVLGSLVGLNRTVEALLDPIIQAFRSIPSLAWVPLFILWMGISEESKVVLIAVGVFFPVYLNIVSGIQNVDRKLVEVGKLYHFSTFELIYRIILPAAMPSYLTGLRSGLGLGWMFVVAAELMGASQGLGFLLVNGQNTYAPEIILSSIVLFAILGKLSDSLLKALEAKVLFYQDRIAK